MSGTTVHKLAPAAVGGVVSAADRRASGRGTSRLLPQRKAWKLRWFTGVSKRYVSRHFNSVRVSREGKLVDDPTVPYVIYLNHASWWDPLACLVLQDALFSHREAYAPIDAEQLRRYGVFQGLGFFGVEAHSPRAGAQFMAASRAILGSPRSVLWITPEGRFQDVRSRPVSLLPGLAHLTSRFPDVRFVPMAMEYAFWNDRLPEIFVKFGSAQSGREFHGDQGVEVASSHLASALEQTMDSLAAEVRSREPRRFTTLLSGRSGVGGIYDCWRWAKAKIQGKPFVARHLEEEL